MHPQESNYKSCKFIQLSVLLKKVKIAIMSSRAVCCNKSPDQFCYICGKWVRTSDRRPITYRVRDLYKQYFGIAVSHQASCWVPHIACSKCTSYLGRWARGGGHLMFGSPMIWVDPIDHVENCYICRTIIVYSRKTEQTVQYARNSSVKLPVLHSEGIPIPVSPGQCSRQNDDCIGDEFETVDLYDNNPADLYENPAYQHEDPLYIPKIEEPHLLTQYELNDLHRDLYLPKRTSEILSSRLQEWKLLQPGVLVTATRYRSTYLAECFATRGNICYCKDIEELFAVMKQPFVSREWRLFIDGSKTSIKAVLLHNGNEKPSIPVAFVTGMKEEYSTMKEILDLIQYNKFNFNIVADFKVIAILMGLQSGYTKYCCYLCLWDSRAYGQHFQRDSWPARTDYTPGEYNVKDQPLVARDKIILPPLHIKLGLMKNFIKALEKTNVEAMEYLDFMFPKLSHMKIHEGIFVGPQIREVLHSEEFLTFLTNAQRAAWESFRAVVTGFLGNNKDPCYKRIIDDMLRKYEIIGARLSLKMHFLKSHKDFFPDNLGAESDEQGERFHQDISDMEDRFNGRYLPRMLGEFCWSLIRETTDIHKRRTPRKHF